MAKIAKDMTRIVAIGKLESYEYDEEKGKYGKGVLDTGKGNKVRFTIFNKDNGDNPHTKAADFAEEFKAGDLVYLTASDNRNVTEDGKTFEGIQVWDFRVAAEDEEHRWVYVYVGTVLELNDDSMVLGVEDYKQKVTEFPILLNGVKIPEGFEVGAKVKVKGTIFSGLKTDFFGDGEFVTERQAVVLEVLNTKEEVEADKEENEGDESGLWD